MNIQKQQLFLANVLIAGSIGPYGACQNDGSEFTGSYTENFSTQVVCFLSERYNKSK